MHRILKPSLAGVVGLVGVAACSPDTSDFKDEAESFIEDDDGDVAQQTGLTFDNAECEEPANKDVNSTFNCTATASDGTTISFVATITGESEFSLGPGSGPPADSTSVPPTSGG